MPQDPSLGQIQYMLEQIETTVGEINQNMVRKDVYAVQREADQERVARIEKDANKAADAYTNSKRAIVTGLVYPTLLLVLAVILNGWIPS
ncbi:MAG: hypothetical protein ACRDT8_00280 [Micromonosporaceae bacterium]